MNFLSLIGGSGSRDALVFAVIDRDGNNVPVLSPTESRLHRESGLPSADPSNAPGFCTVEPADALGYEFLVRFFARATGALAVTVRTSEVEQVLCSSEAGGAITFADLRKPNPAFVQISPQQLVKLSRTVAQIVR